MKNAIFFKLPDWKINKLKRNNIIKQTIWHWSIQTDFCGFYDLMENDQVWRVRGEHMNRTIVRGQILCWIYIPYYVTDMNIADIISCRIVRQ